MLDSIPSYHLTYPKLFRRTEWVFTVLFTIEYFLRIYCSPRPHRYVFSTLGVIDLLAILPSYLSLLVPGTEVLSIIRVLRVLRIFRILKLGQYLGEADLLLQALLASRRKIGLFLFFIMNVVVILGSFMYLIEGEQSGFDSIPRAVYWAIVTLTTVGYGDISPTTNLGQAIASIVMIMGYCTLAIPTGVVSTALASAAHQKAIDASSPNEGPPTPETAPLEPCHACGHLCLKAKDRFCSQCGTALGLAQDTRP